MMSRMISDVNPGRVFLTTDADLTRWITVHRIVQGLPSDNAAVRHLAEIGIRLMQATGNIDVDVIAPDEP